MLQKAPFILCSVVTTGFMCLFFTAIALYFPVISQVIEGTACSIPFCFLCILLVGRRSPCVLHHLLPSPSLSHGCKSGTEQRHQNVYLHIMQERMCPCAIFFIELNLVSALKLVWGGGVCTLTACPLPSCLYDFRPT